MSDQRAENTYIAIEVFGNLLERGVAGLDVEDVDNNQLDCKPDVVHNVVFPVDVFHGDWVDILVAVFRISINLPEGMASDLQEQCNINHQEHESHAFRTNAVGQNLSRVANKQTRPSHVVEHVVEEDHRYYSVGGRLVTMDSELRRANRPDNEDDQHASGSDQEQRTSSNLVNKEALASGNNNVQNLKTAVDDELDVAVCDSNRVEDQVEVVGD